MFVGYSVDHRGDVYRMYDIGTKGIKVTQDVIWLGKMYGVWKGISGKELFSKED